MHSLLELYKSRGPLFSVLEAQLDPSRRFKPPHPARLLEGQRACWLPATPDAASVVVWTLLGSLEAATAARAIALRPALPPSHVQPWRARQPLARLSRRAAELSSSWCE